MGRARKPHGAKLPAFHTSFAAYLEREGIVEFRGPGAGPNSIGAPWSTLHALGRRFETSELSSWTNLSSSQ